MKRYLQKITLIVLILLVIEITPIKVWAQSNPMTTGPIGSQITYGVNEDIKYWNGTVWVTIPSGLPGQNLKFVNGVPIWVNNPNGFTTNAITNITDTNANSGGQIASSSGSQITARGVCWSTNHNPTIADSHTSDDIGKGNFTSNLTGLSPGILCYVRAYATNSAGTSYGNEVSFKASIILPVLTTTTATSITGTIAMCGGSIVSNGGATIIACGVCWSINHNPTITDSITSDSPINGLYTSSITGILPGTTYYVRAYAKNILGTAYGNEISFTTITTLPTLTTNLASSITNMSVISGGNITNNGGVSIISKGVCWNTSHNPTINNSITINGTGNGNFASSIIGLASGTTYYIRAYATNSVGTAYGNEISFTTQATDIDGNVYDAVTIGTQIWLQQNLNVTHYNNGDLVPNVTDNNSWNVLSSGAYADYNNDASNSIILGRLYNFYAVADSRNLCPTGWHVSSDAEWITLITYLGGTNIAGGKLKEIGLVHWNSPNTGATNESGFTALSTGTRDITGSYNSGIGNNAHYWTSTVWQYSNAWFITLYCNQSYLANGYTNMRYGFSVRCVKN